MPETGEEEGRSGPRRRRSISHFGSPQSGDHHTHRTYEKIRRRCAHINHQLVGPIDFDGKTPWKGELVIAMSTRTARTGTLQVCIYGIVRRIFRVTADGHRWCYTLAQYCCGLIRFICSLSLWWARTSFFPIYIRGRFGFTWPVVIAEGGEAFCEIRARRSGWSFRHRRVAGSGRDRRRPATVQTKARHGCGCSAAHCRARVAGQGVGRRVFVLAVDCTILIGNSAKRVDYHDAG